VIDYAPTVRRRPANGAPCADRRREVVESYQKLVQAAGLRLAG